MTYDILSPRDREFVLLEIEVVFRDIERTCEEREADALRAVTDLAEALARNFRTMS